MFRSKVNTTMLNELVKNELTLLIKKNRGNSQERPLENVLDGMSTNFGPGKNVLWK